MATPDPRDETAQPDHPAKFSPRIMSLANGLILLLAVLSAVLCLLGIMLEIQQGQTGFQSKTCWAFASLTVGLLAFRRFAGAAARLNLLALLGSLALLELLLQVTAWLGLLPLVNTKERIPWGRVYWTAEGLGNSVRNREGWYYPEFHLANTQRLAVIGDSFVEGVEVHRRRNLGVVLGERLQALEPGRAVLSLGSHGTGPAHYLEVLQHAQRHYAIREAVIVVYLGNDITDCSPALYFLDPEQFIYYTRTPNGELILPPAGERARAAYERDLERSYQPVWHLLPRLLISHCMSVQIPLSVKNTLGLRRKMATNKSHPTTQVAGPETQLAALGLKAAPFAVTPTPEVIEAMALLKSLLERSASYSQEHSIQLRLMTIPFFPPDFYAQTNGPDWTAQLAGYDFLKPERELTQWAEKNKIPILPLGAVMQRTRMTPEQIRALYLSHGSGHFTEAGHRFAGEALATTFYEKAR